MHKWDRAEEQTADYMLAFCTIFQISIPTKILMCQCVEYTILWRDHFGAARFVVTLFGIAHFGADLFGANFTKIIFSSFQFFNL